MKNLVFGILIVWIIFIIDACIPKTETPLTGVQTNLNDIELQKLLQLQKSQKVDSLYVYLRSKNPTYRFHALRSLASIRDVKSIDSVFPLLDDQIMEVRAAAAFALGQIGEKRAVSRLLTAFRAKDTISVNNIFNANILEAVGKTGDVKQLKSLATVQTYRVTDTMLLLGQIKAIYRFMLRGITVPEGNQAALRLLKNAKHAEEVRLYAAHYFARGKDLGIEKYGKDLVSVLNSTKEMELRLPLVTAIGKTKDTTLLSNLKALLITTQDPRMKINVIKALGNFPYAYVRLEIGSLLKDKDHQIALTASQFFLQHGIREDLEYYQLQITDSLHWKVRANLYGCLLKHAPIYNTKSKAFITGQIKSLFDKSNNPYEKAQLVFAISQDPFNYAMLETLNAQNMAPVRIAITEGYKHILLSPHFFKAFGYGYPKIKANILDILASKIVKNEPGSITVAAQILREPTLGWKEWIKDTEFLKEALRKIKMPEGLEDYRELDHTIHYLEGKPYKPVLAQYHQAINWEVLMTATDSSAVAVKTTKGTFRIRLHPRRAPFSVSNFLQLMQKNYFNQKIFHRVEPNFVIQTGCPRGDGYGSLDYTIPSELCSGNYTTEGLVGMASAGNHTECSQWFVTHSAAPHLDGNYTIFGHVIDGMDVVKSLDVGDKIIETIFIK